MCIGQACTMGSLLLAAGAFGMRSAVPNSRTAARASNQRRSRADCPWTVLKFVLGTKARRHIFLAHISVQRTTQAEMPYHVCNIVVDDGARG